MQAWLRILIEPETGNATANAWRMASLKSFFDVLLPSQHLLSLGLYAASSLALLVALLRAWSRLPSSVSSRPSSPVSSSPFADDDSSAILSRLTSKASPGGSSAVSTDDATIPPSSAVSCEPSAAGDSFVIASQLASSASLRGSSVPSTDQAAGSSWDASARPLFALSLPALWAFTSLVAVLV